MKILSMQQTSPENSVGWWTEECLAEKETDPITEPFLSDEAAHNYAIRDLLKLNFSDYCHSHPVPEFKLKTLNAMINCKTGKLGYNLIHCRYCGKIEMRSCSCGNRNCPSCGYLEEKRWTVMRQAEVIPGIPYFHLVFTLPHTLADIMYQNQKDTLAVYGKGLFVIPKNPVFYPHLREKAHFKRKHSPRRTGWESAQKNFLYKEVHRVRTGADSVQKKYFPDCLVKTGLFLCHV